MACFGSTGTSTGTAAPTRPRGATAGKRLTSALGGEFVGPHLDGLLRPPPGSRLRKDGVGAIVAAPATALPRPQPGRWTPRLVPAASPEDGRSQLVFLEAALAQYGDTRLNAEVVSTHDWPVERVRAAGGRVSPQGPLLSLVSPSGEVAREWSTFASPADLGLTLRHVLGAPRGSPPLAR